MPSRWPWIGVSSILIAVLAGSVSCRKPAEERKIEIWVSSQDRPQIRAYANEWWAYGSSLQTFNVKLGPSPGKFHISLEGELAWIDADKGQAEFSYELTNQFPVVVAILGVVETERSTAGVDPKVTSAYPPGKHSFKKTFWVKYTYD